MLHPQFLNLLYGEKLYRVPDMSTPPIKFFDKPKGNITFFIRDAEFRRQELTDMLKRIVDAMGIPHEEVCFGKIERPAAADDFGKMKTKFGLIFDLSYQDIGSEISPEGPLPGLYVLPSLDDMNGNEPIKRKAWQIMKRIAEVYKK